MDGTVMVAVAVAGFLIGFGKSGNPLTQTYDLASNTETVADRLGNETTLTFDGRGNIVSETNSLGHTVGYTYDARDNPIACWPSTRMPRVG